MLRPLCVFATQARLPVAYGWKALAKEGVLISYATQSTELFRRAAGYVDKILIEASTATLPVEQPTKFELVVNLKVAKVLGLAIPESVIVQADEVISKRFCACAPIESELCRMTPNQPIQRTVSGVTSCLR